jgi:hypothetical protein
MDWLVGEKSVAWRPKDLPRQIRLLSGGCGAVPVEWLKSTRVEKHSPLGARTRLSRQAKGFTLNTVVVGG